MRKVGQGVLELLVENEKVTDLPTDMCKAIMPSLLRGGDTYVKKILGVVPRTDIFT